MFESYLTGLVVSGGIIIAIGAQNAYVLGLAVRREYHWWSAGLCMSTDLLLVTAGMFGVSAMLLAVPEALAVMRWLGVAFLAWLAVQGLYRAATGRQGLVRDETGERGLAPVLLATLGVTVLNPQVYLDTLLLIPSVGAQQENAAAFVAGAGSASVLWFSLLAWGGSLLSPWLSRPMAWRLIDGGIAVMMAAIALQLAGTGVDQFV
ncbi:LysE/ArgO family amino acid transporter [Halomonas elongata]|uniref:LysE family arginine export protein ArgO n=2 Tax=Halomonas elongata TaxID=2746 RepID=E1V7X0_HALED|nr:LysE family transporter [Halomonas elongata]MBW5801353.1 LysE family transporter [Halomonas elongata]MDL4864472.1 LysE family transporter [Halomonas elongata]OBX37646.1 arginine exporter protein ArgO [Halomonas elongata]RAW07343.1 lysine transporter LysE [Halomonas elongata]WBF18772.1 LysE family transporter [Halomonas elongata]